MTFHMGVLEETQVSPRTPLPAAKSREVPVLSQPPAQCAPDEPTDPAMHTPARWLEICGTSQIPIFFC